MQREALREVDVDELVTEHARKRLASAQRDPEGSSERDHSGEPDHGRDPQRRTPDLADRCARPPNPRVAGRERRDRDQENEGGDRVDEVPISQLRHEPTHRPRDLVTEQMSQQSNRAGQDPCNRDVN